MLLVAVTGVLQVDVLVVLFFQEGQNRDQQTVFVAVLGPRRPLWRSLHAGLCLRSHLPEKIRETVGGEPLERNMKEKPSKVEAAGEFLTRESH